METEDIIVCLYNLYIVPIFFVSVLYLFYGGSLKTVWYPNQWRSTGLCPYQQEKSFGNATGMSAANKQLSNPFNTEQQKPVAPIS